MKEEYQESIREDLKRCEIFPDEVTYTSDHFMEIYELTLQLIKDGKAYMDDTDQETMRDERMKFLNSKNREMSIETTLAKFQELKEGKLSGVCLRAKINMYVLILINQARQEWCNA
jgi:glutamyl-tRNA synthetase